MRSFVVLGGLTFGAVLAAGCGGANAVVESAKQTGTPASAAQGAPAVRLDGLSCARVASGGAMRGDDKREGSTVAIARLGDKTIAYLADEDAKAIHTLDIAENKVIAKTPLAGAPSQLVVLADGRVAVVLRDANRVEVLEPAATVDQPLVGRCTVPVAVEPVGLSVTPDDGRVLVTSAWGKALTALDTKTMKRQFEAKLPREARAVVTSDNGDRAFVSHVVNATMSVVDLVGEAHEVREVDLRVRKISGQAARFGSAPDDKLRAGCQGFALAKSVDVEKPAPGQVDAPPTSGEKPPVKLTGPKPEPKAPRPVGRIFAPMVTVEPGDPNVKSPAYYGDVFDGVAKEAPIVSVIDAAAERTITKNVMSLGQKLAKECILPRSATVRGSTGSLFVTCLGIDAVVELDTRGLDPARLERRRWSVPAGPTGIAIDDKSGRAVVWSQFTPGASIIDLKAQNEAQAVQIARVDLSVDPVFAAGRRLYHATDDRRISSDGSSCASCHPEGREDAITWATPDGPRQTIMLAGRVQNTAPFGWIGKHDSLKSYVTGTFTRLGGSGLGQGDPEFDALLAYVEQMPSPAIGDTPDLGPTHEQMLARGKDLFFNEEQGCATCHVGGTTDKVKHDVGSKAKADDVLDFDTPSLRFISGTAPYFHDGRYATLQAMLRATDSKMGHTAQLSQKDVDALEAYLDTL